MSSLEREHVGIRRASTMSWCDEGELVERPSDKRREGRECYMCRIGGTADQGRRANARMRDEREREREAHLMLLTMRRLRRQRGSECWS